MHLYIYCIRIYPLYALIDILLVEETFCKCIKFLLFPWGLLLSTSIFLGTILLFLEPCYNVALLESRYAEKDLNFCVWIDIIDASFFVMSTIATIGYGEPLVPATLLGRGVAVACMLLGVLFMALPLAIVRSKYQSTTVSGNNTHNSNCEREFQAETNLLVRQQEYCEYQLIEECSRCSQLEIIMEPLCQ